MSSRRVWLLAAAFWPAAALQAREPLPMSGGGRPWRIAWLTPGPVGAGPQGILEAFVEGVEGTSKFTLEFGSCGLTGLLIGGTGQLGLHIGTYGLGGRDPISLFAMGDLRQQEWQSARRASQSAPRHAWPAP